jgi:antitoxin component YwqK of YwqJK toxin-antitoxin module
LLVVLFLTACEENSQVTAELVSALPVDFSELTLDQNKGVYTYQKELFTGLAQSFYQSMIKAEEIHFTNGKKNGKKKIWFKNGHLSYECTYINGKLNGTSKTWWKNDTLRSISNYKMGVVDGQQLQWYQSGAKFKALKIVNGREEGMQKAWRENGEIYNNYEAKNGRIFGLKRATLCFTLEDEEIILD